MREDGETKQRCCSKPSKKQCALEIGYWGLGVFEKQQLWTDWEASTAVQGDTPASDLDCRRAMYGVKGGTWAGSPLAGLRTSSDSP